MKILVDELPYYDTDCSFFKRGECLLCDQPCPLTKDCTARCGYLKEVGSENSK